LPNLIRDSILQIPETRNKFLAPVTQPEAQSLLSRNLLQSWGHCDLETQFGCSLAEELDLLSAVSLLVVLSAFINVSLTVL
jgi:hypothetical protein